MLALREACGEPLLPDLDRADVYNNSSVTVNWGTSLDLRLTSAYVVPSARPSLARRSDRTSTDTYSATGNTRRSSESRCRRAHIVPHKRGPRGVSQSLRSVIPRPIDQPHVPVAITGARGILPSGVRLAARPGMVSVRLLEPLATAGLSVRERKALCDRAESAVPDALASAS